MAIKKIVASLLAASMVGSAFTAIVLAEAQTPEGYLYYEDFENGINTAYNSPASAAGRWSSSLEGDDENHYMKYTVDTSVEFTGKNGEAYYVRVEGKNRNNPDYPLDRDSWYELGYKFNMNDCKPRFGSFMQIELGSVQAQTVMQGWNTGINNGMIFLENGKDDSGNVSTISINQDDVDGFISTKILFNLHGSTQNDTNFNTNGEAIYYISYKTKAGKEVNEHRKLSFPSASNTNNEARSSRFFQGIRMGESWNGKPANGSSFFIDDIYIKERKTYTVTFEKNDGSGETLTGKSDLDGVVALPEVTREDWQFDGWYSDAELTEPFDGTSVTKNMSVYAKWLKIHTVTFELNGGTGVESLETVTGAIELPTPTKIRHEFDGWYKDEKLTEPFDGTGITGDMTVYAKWKYAWEIKFNTNGGNPIEPMYAVDTLKNIPIAEWLGYRFDGWFRDAELTEPFDGTGITNDIEVYAKWTKQYKIEFESNGGGELNPLYTLEDIDVSTLPKPKKQGFAFENWYRDKELTEIFDGKNITGDITIYAKYNNVIFYQDFENADEKLNEEWMKQLAPTQYAEYIKNGYGIVDDGREKGNKAFRLAWEKNKNLSIPFDDGGKGMYEVSFKIIIPREYQGLIAMLSPRKQNVTVLGVSSMGNRINIGSEALFYNKLIGKADGYINVVYRIDTVNMIADGYADYKDLVSGETLSDVKHMITFTAKADTVDNLLISTGSNVESQGSDYYIDDICVKKIDQPYIEKITPAENEKDVDINSNVRVQFSDTVDKSTITNETLCIKDEDGNTVSAYTDIATENGKTVATIRPNSPFEYEKTYTVIAGLGISKGVYNLKQPYEIKFKTRPLTLEYSVSLTDAETGNTIDNLADAKGRKVKAVFNIRNYEGEASQSYFVGAALVDTSNGAQKNFVHSQGEVIKGEQKEIISTEFDILTDVTENYKIKFFVWSAAQNRIALTDVIAVP